jgi:tetratricopeptide (TPR) repeat protein
MLFFALFIENYRLSCKKFYKNFKIPIGNLVKRGTIIFLVFLFPYYGIVLNGSVLPYSGLTAEQNRHKTTVNDVNRLRVLLGEQKFDEADKYYFPLSKIEFSDISFDTLLFSDLNYYMGAYLLVRNRLPESLERTLLSVSLRESIGVKDLIYRNALSNIGAVFYSDGKYHQAVEIYESLLETSGPKS